MNPCRGAARCAPVRVTDGMALSPPATAGPEVNCSSPATTAKAAATEPGTETETAPGLRPFPPHVVRTSGFRYNLSPRPAV